MRKLTFQEWISMDGFAADSNGNTNFLQASRLNSESDLDQFAWMDSIDTILLGANTYKMFVEFWPNATNEQVIIADKLNNAKKIVFSKSLTNAPWGKWPNAEIIATDAITAVKKLKLLDGKDMVLWGSISLAQSFMKANLIDEYHLRICPVVLGSGRPLFELTGPLNFELFDAKKYESGLMFLQYRVQS